MVVCLPLLPIGPKVYPKLYGLMFDLHVFTFSRLEYDLHNKFFFLLQLTGVRQGGGGSFLACKDLLDCVTREVAAPCQARGCGTRFLRRRIMDYTARVRTRGATLLPPPCASLPRLQHLQRPPPI